MNLRKTTTRNALTLLVALAVTFGLARVCQADPYCDDNSGDSPYICVNKSGADPYPGTDFTFDFSDPDNPDVTLKTADLAWEVWSQVSDEDNTPANLGDITIDPDLPSSEDFELTIAHGALAGASTLGSVVLTDAGWTGYSTIEGGGISGNLTGDLTVKEDSGNNGGVLNFEIAANVSGNIIAHTITNLEIGGDFTGGRIDAGEIAYWCTLTVEGHLHGDIQIDCMSDLAQLWVDKDVKQGAAITIGEMGDYTFVFLNEPQGQYDTHGGLELGNGVPSGCGVAVYGELTSTGWIDLTGDDVDSTLSIYGDVSGDIVNIHNVDGRLAVEGDLNSGAEIEVENDVTGARTTNGIDIDGHVAGTISVGRDVTGTIDVEGDLVSTGDIWIGRAISGSGDVTVHGDVAGDITVGDDVSGTIDVGDTLTRTGRILVDGMCNGPITIGEATVACSLILCEEGLDDSGVITINDSAGHYDANGDIYIGDPGWTGPTLPDITFDGSIMIENTPGGGAGDLNGDITVNGCHATTDDLDICICGDNNGTVDIIQGGCRNQVDWSCVTGCP